jgi:hypothetical protein
VAIYCENLKIATDGKSYGLFSQTFAYFFTKHIKYEHILKYFYIIENNNNNNNNN